MKKTILDNGLTIVSYENPYSKSTCISYGINAGSYQEQGYPEGIAHFVEHMNFKGTKKRSYKDINDQIVSLGGDINAFTSFEETKYYAIVPFNSWKEGLEVLSDMIWNSTYLKKEITKEKNIILEEKRMDLDETSTYIFDKLQEKLYKDTNINPNILGTLDSIKSIKQEDIVSFVNHFYIPKNITIVATGNVKHEEIVEFMNNYNITRENKDTDNYPIKEIKFNIEEKELHYQKSIEQAQLSTGMFINDSLGSQFYTMQVILNLMCGNMSSRLHDIIREEKGLCYDLNLDGEFFSNHATLYFQAGTEKENLQELKEIFIRELFKLKSEKVQEEELKRTLSFTTGHFMIALENNIFLNDFISGMNLYGLEIDPDKYIENVKQVTSNDIYSFANKYFIEENMILMSLSS